MEQPKKNQASVTALLTSINQIVQLQSENLADHAKGETPKIVLDPKIWDMTLKIIEKLPNLQMLEKVLNGEVAVIEKKSETKSEDGETEAIVKSISDVNPFEARSKVIKAKLNGSTNQ